MRVLVVWCPDWPVVAAAAEEDLSRDLPAAVFSRNLVVACNAAARLEGVRRGMRRRDAQSRCPELVLLDANPDRDARAFEPVLAAVEELRPGVAPLRPGLLAIRSPARYYGGEENAAAVVAEQVVAAGAWDCRVGIADDLFTAEQAARHADVQACTVVPAGESAAFLQELPVEVLDGGLEGADGRDLVGLLRRLGLRQLGDLAGLPAADVLTRFGPYAARVHRLLQARRTGERPLAARTPPPELTAEVSFEPPLESTEAVCFSVRRTAEELVARLGARELVGTVVRRAAHTDRGTVSARSWAHSRWFAAADLVDRVHWQLESAAAAGLLDGPICRVVLQPETVEPAGAHAEALWGSGTDERVERGVAKVQAMLGYDAACRPVRQGGRSPADRQALVPWGERAVGLRPVAMPWPGSVPSPAPTRVFREPRPAVVVGATGQPVRVDERGELSSPPARFRPARDQAEAPVSAWAGPWPVDEAWWEEREEGHGVVSRFQVVGADGRAWLLRCGPDGWWTEASYD
jgi:protein ImuB